MPFGKLKIKLGRYLGVFIPVGMEGTYLELRDHNKYSMRFLPFTLHFIQLVLTVCTASNKSLYYVSN